MPLKGQQKPKKLYHHFKEGHWIKMSKLVIRKKKESAAKVTFLQVAQRLIKDTFASSKEMHTTYQKRLKKSREGSCHEQMGWRRLLERKKSILVKASSCVQVRKTERIVIFGRLKHKTQSRVRGLQDQQLPTGWRPEAVGAVHGQSRTLLPLAREKSSPRGSWGQPQPTAHSVEMAKARVRIRLGEEPPTDTHQGASA